MKKTAFSALIALVFLTGCATDIDRSSMTPEERFQYAMSLYNDESYLDAVSEFESILIQFPGSSIAPNAQFYLGMARFKRGEYLMGAYEFSKLINRMKTSDFIKDAQFMIADCYYELSPNYALDQKYSEKAIEEFQAFINFFPTDPKVEEAERKIAELNDKLAEKLFSNAETYENMGMLNAAIEYYGFVTEKYHDSQYSPRASYKKIVLLIERKRYKDALKETENFISRYKNDPNLGSVQKIRDDILKMPQFSAQN